MIAPEGGHLHMSTIVIADDHPLFRDALAAAVRRVVPEAAIQTASCLTQARDALGADVHLLLLDIHMADSDGLAGLVAIRHDHPALPVVVVSASEGASVQARAIAFGAAGFIPKSTGLDRLCAALEAVLAGEIWAPLPDRAAADPGAPDTEALARLASLTPAQLRVLIGVRDGRLNKQIAYDMGITEATVKAHLTAIFRKLGVINRAQAVRAAEALEIDRPAVTG